MTPSAAVPATAANGGPSPGSRAPASSNHQLLFKKHKVLPHPRKDATYASLRGLRLPPPAPAPPKQQHDVSLASSAIAPSAAASSDDAAPASPRTLKHYPKALRNGPDLPPTPPAHSRNSSATYSVPPSSAAGTQSPERSAEDVQLKPVLPTTPTKQMSPPTPDVTPPQALPPPDLLKGAALPPPQRARNLSKGTADSRTESFKTARENPSSSSSDDEDRYSGYTVLRPPPTSARTSESTVRPIADTARDEPAKKHEPKAVGLGLGLESSPEESITPKSKRDFVSFDGEWGARSEGPAREWDDDSPKRNAVPNHRLPHRNATAPISAHEVLGDVVVTPSNATKALRSMSLPQRILTFPSPAESSGLPEQDQHRQERPKQSHRQPQQQQQQQRHKRDKKQDQPLASAAPIVAQTMSSPDSSASDQGGQRVSIVSSRSAASTVVEAVLFGTPPQRRPTLRHVKKQDVLRDSALDLSPGGSAPTSLLLDETNKQRRPNGGRLNSSAHDSIVSTSTINSISSRSARREVWKAGAIPVVIVPRRLSSARSNSREPSLRSTSSRRSRRSQSLTSVPLSHTTHSREISPNVDQRGRRGRTYSESGSSAPDGSAPGDQRTMDFPPVVPRRTSSLSAPTSRNVSRSGSLTAESIQAQARLREESTKSRPGAEEPVVSSQQPNGVAAIAKHQDHQSQENAFFPEGQASRTADLEQTNLNESQLHRDHDDDGMDGEDGPGDYGYDNRIHFDPRASLDRPGDRSSARHLSPHNTPFSMVSVETNHSQAEVSEALAVNIYPHQNTSVLVVNHSNRPSDCSSDSQRDDRLTDVTEPSTMKQEPSPVPEYATPLAPSMSATLPPTRPTIVARGPQATEDVPVTPAQQLFSLDDVDSPWRNPRSPPQPPAINFIPATPSGLTPAPEKSRKQGNYRDVVEEGQPPRRSVSLTLRRALSRGRSTTKDYGPSASRSGGLLTRTLSLTRDVQKRALSVRRSRSVDRGKEIMLDIEPADETKLHPFWRPSFPLQLEGDDADEDGARRGVDDDEGETYRYPPVDNRPHAPRRSFSSRMKRTFAILPLDDNDGFYPATSDDGTDRRTVRRTPSGNLRVVKHRGSIESFRRSQHAAVDGHPRPYTAPEHHGNGFRFWRNPSFGKAKNALPNDEEAAVRRDKTAVAKILPNIGGKIGEYGPHTIPRRFSERRREKRSNELRQMISAPREVRDGVGEVIRRTHYRDAFTRAQVS